MVHLHYIGYPAGNYKAEACNFTKRNTSRRRSGVFIVNFEHISQFVLVFSLQLY